MIIDKKKRDTFIFFIIILIGIIALYIYLAPLEAGRFLVTDKYEYKNDYIITIEYGHRGKEEIKIKLGRKIELIDEDNHLIKEVNSKEAYDFIKVNKTYFIGYYVIENKLYNFSDVYGRLISLKEKY